MYCLYINSDINSDINASINADINADIYVCTLVDQSKEIFFIA